MMLNFLLAAIIVGTGIIIGAVLTIIAREEIKPGKKYFVPLKWVLFSSILITTSIYYIRINYIISIITLILFSVFFIERFHTISLYISFAIIYILSYTNDKLFLIISSLIFIAGLPIGSLAALKLKQEKEVFIEKKILIPYFIFLLIILSRYLITLF